MAMYKIAAYLNFILIYSCLYSSSTFADIQVIDDAGRTVSVKQPVRRIISLSPHTTELLYSAGAGDYVVAVSAYSDFPEKAGKLPVISGGSGIDIERIIGFEPDLVVAWQSGNPQSQLRQLETLGLTIFYSEPATIDAIASNVESLGKLSGTGQVASKIASEFRFGVKELRSKYQNATRLNAFYQIWSPPLMTIGGAHLISQWLALCGVGNVFSEQTALAPVVSKESVLSRNPDVLISGQFGLSLEAFQKRWSKWEYLSAIIANNLITQDSTVLARQVPRALASATQLCQALDQFRAINSSAIEHRDARPVN